MNKFLIFAVLLAIISLVLADGKPAGSKKYHVKKPYRVQNGYQKPEVKVDDDDEKVPENVYGDEHHDDHFKEIYGRHGNKDSDDKKKDDDDTKVYGVKSKVGDYKKHGDWYGYGHVDLADEKVYGKKDDDDKKVPEKKDDDDGNYGKWFGKANVYGKDDHTTEKPDDDDKKSLRSRRCRQQRTLQTMERKEKRLRTEKR